MTAVAGAYELLFVDRRAHLDACPTFASRLEAHPYKLVALALGTGEVVLGLVGVHVPVCAKLLAILYDYAVALSERSGYELLSVALSVFGQIGPVLGVVGLGVDAGLFVGCAFW